MTPAAVPLAKDTGLALAALTLVLSGSGTAGVLGAEPSRVSAPDAETAARVHQNRLPEALDAPRRELRLPGVGLVSYYQAGIGSGSGSGTPLLLVHSIKEMGNPPALPGGQ